MSGGAAWSVCVAARPESWGRARLPALRPAHHQKRPTGRPTGPRPMGIMSLSSVAIAHAPYDLAFLLVVISVFAMRRRLPDSGRR
ncbi:protein of unknown function [Rhodovastum atsumiense]|nr:protein of unknown function [Rhodovastum atsumiense]